MAARKPFASDLRSQLQLLEHLTLTLNKARHTSFTMVVRQCWSKPKDILGTRRSPGVTSYQRNMSKSCKGFIRHDYLRVAAHVTEVHGCSHATCYVL